VKAERIYYAAQIGLFDAGLTRAYAAKGGPAVLLVRGARHRRWHLGVRLCVSVSNPSCAVAKSASRTHVAEDRLREFQQTLRIMTELRQRMRAGEVQRKMRARRT
jgi:hypothetical protein